MCVLLLGYLCMAGWGTCSLLLNANVWCRGHIFNGGYIGPFVCHTPYSILFPETLLLNDWLLGPMRHQCLTAETPTSGGKFTNVTLMTHQDAVP